LAANPSTTKKLSAEFLGTFVLVFGGCGTAVLSTSGEPGVGVGWLGVALAFGLTVVVMAYAVGHISGGHFNPAVTLGAAAGGRIPWKDTPAYIVTQVVAGIAAGAVLLLIASGRDGFSAKDSGFASNGYGDRSPMEYHLLACLVIEVLLTAVFIWVILGATDSRAPKGLAPLAIGLSLTLIHLISIPVTNTSVNPARSTGPALFVGGWALGQLWLFWVAPMIGGVLGGVIYRWLSDEPAGVVAGRS
jgi:aquaporin Z